MVLRSSIVHRLCLVISTHRLCPCLPLRSAREVISELDTLAGGCVLCHETDFQRGGFGPRTIMLCDQVGSTVSPARTAPAVHAIAWGVAHKARLPKLAVRCAGFLWSTWVAQGKLSPTHPAGIVRALLPALQCEREFHVGCLKKCGKCDLDAVPEGECHGGRGGAVRPPPPPPPPPRPHRSLPLLQL